MNRDSVVRYAIRWVLAAALAAGLLAWLLRGASLRSLLDAAAALPAWAWAAAALGMFGTYALRAVRMRSEWAHVERAGLLECVRIVLGHNVGLMLLPMRAGEVGYVLLVRQRWGASLTDAAASLVWWRLQDAFVLVLLAVALLPPWPAPARIALALALLLASVTALPALLRAGRRRAGWIDRVAATVVAHRGDLTGWVCCCSSWALKITVIGGLFAALTVADADAALRAALGGELAGALPVQGPAGLGTYEVAAWAAARLPDPAGQHLAASALLIHVFCIVVAVLAAAVLNARRPPVPTEPALPSA